MRKTKKRIYFEQGTSKNEISQHLEPSVDFHDRGILYTVPWKRCDDELMDVLQARRPFLHHGKDVLLARCPFLHQGREAVLARCPFLQERTDAMHSGLDTELSFHLINLSSGLKLIQGLAECGIDLIATTSETELLGGNEGEVIGL